MCMRRLLDLHLSQMNPGYISPVDAVFRINLYQLCNVSWVKCIHLHSAKFKYGSAENDCVIVVKMGLIKHRNHTDTVLSQNTM